MFNPHLNSYSNKTVVMKVSLIIKKKLEHLLIHIFLFILEGGDKHASITNSLIYMICKDLLPLGCTEKQGMRRFLKTVVPMYRPPSRKKV